MADRLCHMSVGDNVQLACRDSLLPFLQQEARAAGGGGCGGGGGAGLDGEELKLLEVDESMLAELLSDGLVIKGTPEDGDEAVMCTRSSTFALKLVTTTNLLLLVPPHENPPENTPEKAHEEAPENTMGASIADIDIKEKKLQIVTIPRVTAAAVASNHLEVVPVAPRLARLTHLLSACAYNERDEEEELRGGEGEGEGEEGGGEGGGRRRGDGGMGGGGMFNGAREGGGGGGSGKRGRRKGYTWQELVGQVQASEEEIRAGLEAAGAVKVGVGER
ncbi:unnamed protein product [Closterium sp. NIES-53]